MDKYLEFLKMMLEKRIISKETYEISLKKYKGEKNDLVIISCRDKLYIIIYILLLCNCI